MDYKEKIKHGSHEFPLEIYNIKTENGLNFYTHYHREFEILYIRSGQGCAYIDDECYNVGEGDILFINSGQLHGIVSLKDCVGEFIAIVFAPEFFGEFDAVSNKYVIPVLNKSVRIPTYIGENNHILDCILDIIERKGIELSELTIKSIMFRMWEMLISKGEQNERNNKDINLEQIKMAIDYIKKNYMYKITLRHLAELTHTSRVYFCKKFTRLLGISPIEYVIRVRIENSCVMLKNTDMSIGNIAMECGFSSFSYYSKIFGQIMGCTPKEYRSRR